MTFEILDEVVLLLKRAYSNISDRQTDGRMDGQTEGWTEGRTNRLITIEQGLNNIRN